MLRSPKNQHKLKRWVILDSFPVKGGHQNKKPTKIWNFAKGGGGGGLGGYSIQIIYM